MLCAQVEVWRYASVKKAKYQGSLSSAGWRIGDTRAIVYPKIIASNSNWTREVRCYPVTVDDRHFFGAMSIKRLESMFQVAARVASQIKVCIPTDLIIFRHVSLLSQLRKLATLSVTLTVTWTDFVDFGVAPTENRPKAGITANLCQPSARKGWGYYALTRLRVHNSGFL